MRSIGPLRRPLTFDVRPHTSRMSKNAADLSFRITSPLGLFSGEWRLWATRHSDVYLASREQAKDLKVSFHQSGVCRYAYTKEANVPAVLPDRLMTRWRRPPPQQRGSNLYTRLAWLAFPTDYLSRGKVAPRLGSKHVPAAPFGQATYVEVCLSPDSLEHIRGALPNRSDLRVELHAPLGSGESLWVFSYHGEWQGEDFRVPASHGLTGYRFSRIETEQPHRPIRFTMLPPPKDGEALQITEFGGCRDAA